MANNAKEKRQKVTWPSGTGERFGYEKMCRLSEVFLQVSAKYGDTRKNYEGTARISPTFLYNKKKKLKRDYYYQCITEARIFIHVKSQLRNFRISPLPSAIC